MAEVVDLLSSTPPRPPSARELSLPTGGTKRRPPKEESPDLNDGLFVSDDEFPNPVVGTGWSWKGINGEEPANKKRRISVAESIISSPQRKFPATLASIPPPSAQPKDQQRNSSVPKGVTKVGGGFYRPNSERYRPGFDDSNDEPEEDSFRSPPPKRKADAPPRRDFGQPPVVLDVSDDELVISETPLGKAKQRMARRNTMADDVVSSSPALTQLPKSTANRAADWDPISSSAPLPAAEYDDFSQPARSFRKVQSEIITLDDSDENMNNVDSDKDEDFPDIMDLASSKSKSTPGSITTRPPPVSRSWNKRFTTGVLSARAVNLPEDQRKTQRMKTPAGKRAGKATKAAALAEERERKHLEKDATKEAKAFEKKRAAALAEVNKLRTDKKVSTPEMIVNLPVGLNPTIKVQTEELLKDLSVQVESSRSPVDNVVRWKRKVDAEYNPSLSIWEPAPSRTDVEKYVMAIMPAAQFVELSLSLAAPDLDSHVSSMKQQFPEYTIIYLIEGLQPFLRKNKSARNRQFASAVRDGLGPASNPPQNRPANPPKIINEDLVESSLLSLQLVHNCLIHHTNAPIETSQQIAVFTQHISTAPYRRLRDLTNDTQAGFCMDSGQVRTGTEAKDIYVRMLQEIGRVTKPIAFGIAGEYESIGQLKRAFEAQGPLILENVRRGTNKDGGFSDRAVGQAISRRIHKILLGRDTTSSDI